MRNKRIREIKPPPGLNYQRLILAHTLVLLLSTGITYILFKRRIIQIAPDYSSFFLFGRAAIFISALCGFLWVVRHLPKQQAEELRKQRPLIKSPELFSIENEARKTLSQIVGGVFVLFGLWITAENFLLAKEEAEKNRTLTLDGQVTDRFTKAISQLGDSKLEIRLGGIYALERITKDSEKDHWAIMKILAAYVRKTSQPTLEAKRQVASMIDPAITILLPTDIQDALSIIAERDCRQDKGAIDLSHAFLARAYFRDANLCGINFIKSDLRNAFLGGASLNDASLFSVNLNQASLIAASLRGADLSGAILTQADFYEADLRGAKLVMADLRQAKNLTWEQLVETIIDDETKLPLEIEERHKEELKAMREKTRSRREVTPQQSGFFGK